MSVKVLPNADKAIIPLQKFIDYVLHPINGKGKAYAFQHALGYDLSNVEKLIENIRQNVFSYEAKYKGDNGFGLKYEVFMELTGENGKSAYVLTGWIYEYGSEYPRLTSAYVKNRRHIDD
jgi:hypothetical protein